MKIDVSDFEKKYSFELMPVTQLCGQNIKKKTYVLESLRRYFSTYKYREEKNKWRDNVKMDSETVGRKFFSLLSIHEHSDILQMIKWSKQSILLDYMKILMEKFEWQLHMRTISEEIDVMFQQMNEELCQVGNLELTYAAADLWNMIQKSDIVGKDEKNLEDIDTYEMLITFLNLLEEVMKVNPKKTMVVLENIDHMVSRNEYVEIIRKLQYQSRKFDVYFVVTTSMQGYVVCDKELCSGIKVFGDVDFQMPEFQKLLNFVHENYPCNKNILETQLIEHLTKIIQMIGTQGYLYNVEENVICKLINQTLLLNEKWKENENLLEIAFLKD